MELVRMAKKKKTKNDMDTVCCDSSVGHCRGRAIYLFLINGNRSPEGEDIKLVYYQRTGGNCIE